MIWLVSQGDLALLVGVTVSRIRHAERYGHATWTTLVADGHPCYDRKAVAAARAHFAETPKNSRLGPKKEAK